MYPLSQPHPIGQANPITFRADAILPAAGAWDASPVEVPVIAFDKLTLYFSYDEDAGVAGAGAFDFYIEYSPYSIDQVGVENWFRMALYAAGVMAAGTDIQSNIQREYITYDSIGATAETFVYGPLDISKTVERMRIVARESGEVGNPGDLKIIGVANS